MSLRDRWRYSATNTRISNWRNRRTLDRGRRDIPRRAGDQVRSRTPVYRNRINPATGTKNRQAREQGRTMDQSLSRMREQRQRDQRTRERSR